ncbi:bactofilin family protein [Ramlibacter sp. MMS24-I3-19]|uniref:bactofilin family protein n=1 Tax=Ramlibacter sp. MMS24-I3-19 TaxID=3416606 RepID=UPI003D05B48D
MPPAIASKRPACTAFLLALCLFAGVAHAAPALDVGDVYAAGGDVRTGGPIRGDFGAAGGKVALDEPVAGKAWLVGGSVEARAPVRDSLHVAAGDVVVDDVVGGKLLAAGGQIAIGPEAVIGGGARLFGGRVTVDGRVDGDLHVSARHVTINGDVRGDVSVRADTVELGPEARVGGTLRYTARNELRKDEGAVVGSIVHQRGRARGEDQVMVARPFEMPGPWHIGGGLVSVLSLLACGAAFLFLVPRYGEQAAERLADGPLGALTLGVVVAVAMPIVAVLLCITVLGIPLGVLLLLAYPVLLLAGFLVAVLAVARRLAAALRKPQPVGFGPAFGWFALALGLVLLASLLPAIGGLAVALMTLGGTGAAVIELQRRRKGGGGAPMHGQPMGAGIA